MRHVRRVSLVREGKVSEPARYCGEARPDLADAKSDFMNAIYRAWSDYVYAKKNEMSV